MGIEGDRALEQLMGTTHIVFNDKRKMIFVFAGDIWRWKGEHMLYRAYFQTNGPKQMAP